MRYNNARNLGKPVFLASPASFDFTFMYWYLINFAGHSPFLFHALDIKSYMMGFTGGEFSLRIKDTCAAYLPTHKGTDHIPYDDAVYLGKMFCNLLKANGGKFCITPT